MKSAAYFGKSDQESETSPVCDKKEFSLGMSQRIRWEIRHKIKCISCFGLRFQCPICGWWFRKMFPFGLKPRVNAQCPFCFSLERHRLLWLYLKDKTNFFTQPLRILHVAPEAGLSKIFKTMPNLQYISADISSKSAMIKMDITQIAMQSNTWDAILCSHTLEHIVDDRKAMRELYRVLKPGGWLIPQVPICGDKTVENKAVILPAERERIYGQRDHVRRYGADYKDRLAEAGFKVNVDDFVRSLGEKRIKKYCLTPAERIYFCTK